MIVWRLSFIFQEVKVGLVAQSVLSVTACLKWVSKMKRRFCPHVFFFDRLSVKMSMNRMIVNGNHLFTILSFQNNTSENF